MASSRNVEKVATMKWLAWSIIAILSVKSGLELMVPKEAIFLIYSLRNTGHHYVPFFLTSPSPILLRLTTHRDSESRANLVCFHCDPPLIFGC